MRSWPRSCGRIATATSSSTSIRPTCRPSATGSGCGSGQTARTGVRATTYAEVATGQIGLVVDSYGLLSIAVDRLSAAEELRLGAGDEVVLERITRR